jgi:hypothetical protein
VETDPTNGHQDGGAMQRGPFDQLAQLSGRLVSSRLNVGGVATRLGCIAFDLDIYIRLL